MQCRKTRVASMFAREADLASLHFGHDAMDFLVHDLMHAHRMFVGGLESLCEQTGALRLLKRACDIHVFDAMLHSDPLFRTAFEYGISDMNTHCLHTLQYVKHAVIAAFLRSRGLPDAARMDAALEHDFYAFFFGSVVASWQEPGLEPGTTAHTALMALCERELSGDERDALVSLCRRVGGDPAQPLPVQLTPAQPVLQS